MKFSLAWAEIATQNSILKLLVIVLAVLSISLGFTTAQLSLRDPLVIDRECFSSAAKIGSNQRSAIEIETFIKEALRQRLDTQATALSEYISDEERNFREQEQKDFQTKRITQKIIVNSIRIDSNSATVDVDRILSVGSIKSVLPLPLLITISTTDRTTANPYGLKIIRVTAARKDDEK